ncbi:PREDICTED: uncharacterized protein LOC109237565 [Nicotiana attenuata]|uniref:uncharacterized protein LOC109237565 n=1 Tax=Nicotiana attenuata TaxID=49451 RepID=UPI00090529A2|nr:PREDICTED: uncharacterized protein LOC109237565 [Nicotiana attenuata]
MPSTAGLSTESLPFLVGEHPTTSTAFDAAASYSLTPSASFPSSSTPTIATSFPSSSTLPPASATSSPPAASDHEEDVPLPQFPIHGILGQNYAAAYEDPQKRKNVTLSVSTGCNSISRPMELANYLKPLASEKANFLASEGLQRLIRDTEELTSKRDQLLAEGDQSVARLSELEAKATEGVVLEAHLQQSKQEVETLSQKIAPLRVQFDEAKTKWVEVHNVVLAASDHEAKLAQLEDKFRKTIEHNRLFSSTVRDLNVSLRSIRSTRESLSAEIAQLNEELKHRAASLARKLELAAKNGLLVQPDAPSPSGSNSEFSGNEEESEDDDAEGQIGENVEPSVDPSTSPGGADTSLPPGSGDTAYALYRYLVRNLARKTKLGQKTKRRKKERITYFLIG